MSLIFGGQAGRHKGGLISQKRRRNNPNLYKSLGCVVKNEFLKPNHSIKLAEFVGVVLGDGGISNTQLHITLNAIADKKYAVYVKNLIFDLFGYFPSEYLRDDCGAILLVVTGVNFIEVLKEMGLFVGNKVKKQVSVPGWITENREYSLFCLRGLIDTDGGIFVHRYKSNGKKYAYLKLCFSNLSQPLRKFAFSTLKIHGFNPKFAGNKHVWLYSHQESIKYLLDFGSSNERLYRNYHDIILNCQG